MVMVPIYVRESFYLVTFKTKDLTLNVEYKAEKTLNFRLAERKGTQMYSRV